MGLPQTRFPAVFMRGGTCKGVFFHRRDLPDDPSAWAPIFLAAIGSPDPYGRQLDGLGGGNSSLSKVAVIAPSADPAADIDYTFGQVAVGEPEVHYRTTCGNLTAAAAHFAVDERMVSPADGEAVVRIFNSNTRKHVIARFGTAGDSAAVDGDVTIMGVSGSGAPVRLEFLEPGGAGTGRLLPSGRPSEAVMVDGLGSVTVSLVDAANPCVFVPAADVGMLGNESPDELDADRVLVERLERIRRLAGVAMGFGPTPDSIGGLNSPKVAVVGSPRATRLLDGRTVPADAMSLSVRLLTLGRFHRALPLTNGMCVAVAAAIHGTVVRDVAAPGAAGRGEILVGTPSGVMPVAAAVEPSGDADGGWSASSATVVTTARRLMDGHVLVPASRISGATGRSSKPGGFPEAP